MKEYLSTHEAFFIMVIIFLPVFTYIEIIFFSQYLSHPQPDLGPEERVAMGSGRNGKRVHFMEYFISTLSPFQSKARGGSAVAVPSEKRRS